MAGNSTLRPLSPKSSHFCPLFAAVTQPAATDPIRPQIGRRIGRPARQENRVVGRPRVTAHGTVIDCTVIDCTVMHWVAGGAAPRRHAGWSGGSVGVLIASSPCHASRPARRHSKQRRFPRNWRTGLANPGRMQSNNSARFASHQQQLHRHPPPVDPRAFPRDPDQSNPQPRRM